MSPVAVIGAGRALAAGGRLATRRATRAGAEHRFAHGAQHLRTGGAWFVRHRGAGCAAGAPVEDGRFAAVTAPAAALPGPHAPTARRGAVRCAPCWTALAAFDARLAQPGTRCDHDAIGRAAGFDSGPALGLEPLGA